MKNIDRKARLCLDIAREKKAFDILLLDIRKYRSLSDYMMICSAGSTTQVKAIVDGIIRILKKNRIKNNGIEGYGHARWVLIDLYDLVIHVFHEETRKFYDLEKLWGLAMQVDIGEDGLQ